MLDTVVEAVRDKPIVLSLAGVAIGAGVLVGTQAAVSRIKAARIKEIALDKAAEKRKRRDVELWKIRRRMLEQSGALMNEERKRIVELDLEHLINALQEKKITALEVLHSYWAKALEVTDSCNCIAEIITESEQWAKELDAMSEPKGPLHGIPFSLKENFDVKGYDSTMGLINRIGKPATKDCDLVVLMKQLGAVPFCKTNVPQALCSYACSNLIYGQTTNPHNKDRVAGGSSGGEAALILCGGSLFGFGSDIGGSARIPAALSGIYSLKPTAGRFSGIGMCDALPYVPGILDSMGVLGRDVKTVAKVFEIMLRNAHQCQLDPVPPPLGWRDQLFEKRASYRIGYYKSLSYFPAVPSCQRPVMEVKKLLESRGYELVEIDLFPNGGQDAYEIFSDIFGHETIGQSGLRHTLKDEPIDESIAPLAESLASPSLLSKLRNIASSVICPNDSDSGKLWLSLQKRRDLITEIVRRWRLANVDVVIGPASACPAPTHEDAPYFEIACLYTMIFNLVNFPAGVVTVSKQTVADEAQMDSYPSDGEMYQYSRNSVNGGTGLPVAVHVVGLPWTEELVLRIMSEIEEWLPPKK